MLTSGQVRDRILKRTSEVGILCIAAVACPPSRVNGELLQIGEPAVLWHAGYPAGWQNGEVAQIDGLRALRCQIIVEKLMMADLVVGVVGDVLRHVTVEHLKSDHVIRSKSGSDCFAIELQIDPREALGAGHGICWAAELSVLNP